MRALNGTEIIKEISHWVLIVNTEKEQRIRSGNKNKIKWKLKNTEKQRRDLKTFRLEEK